MKRSGTLLLGDLHVDKNSLDEIESISKEIQSIPSSGFIQLGDLCDKNRLDPIELHFLTRIAKEWSDTFDFVKVLKGNHDSLDGNYAIIDYLKLLNIDIVNDEYLYEGFLLGHWFVNKSRDAFGRDFRYTVEELLAKDFRVCFLGHQHDFQEVDERIIHLGSSRYVKFGEHPEIKKRAVWLHDGIIEYIPLSSPIPIYNVSSIKELEFIPSRAKVRFLFKSFDSLKEDLKAVEKLKSKFKEFKTKIDFKSQNKFSNDSIEAVKSKTIIEDWLHKVEDSEIRKILEEEFIQEFK